MNNARRKQIDALMNSIEILKSQLSAIDLSEIESAVSELPGDIESIKEEEQEYFDNMPEGLQGGEKGQNSEASISELEDAQELLSGMVDVVSEFTLLADKLDDVISHLDNAKQ